MEIPPVAPAQNRVARELMALALLALAVFGVLSLVSAAAGQNPNLCGILGGAAAAMADDLFGVQAYLLAIMVAVLAIRVWSGAPGRTMVRESFGGAVLLVALSAGAGLFAAGAQSAGGGAGGAIGGALAATLGSYLNVGGGYLCVMLAVIAALVMMLRRSPTELMAGLASSVRLRRREPRSLPIDDDGDWSAGDADISARAAACGTASAQSSARTSADVRPLKVRRLEPTELRTRDNKSM
ncbi:MAG: DNA translocase FtsK 4TM domain-containing protein, partial [Candidatus Binataceae bacterium]